MIAVIEVILEISFAGAGCCIGNDIAHKSVSKNIYIII
jgi:hypothetical protein